MNYGEFMKSKLVLYKELLALLKRLEAIKQQKENQYNWLKNARKNQLPPRGNWRIWLILAGRGFGKTRTGAETIRTWVNQNKTKRIALIGETENDVRQVMIEGESGLLSVYPPEKRPLYEPSKRQITWPNGTIATTYSAELYEQLRGPQFDAAWIDELAKFTYPEKVWDQLMFSLRLGKKPRVIITTTPKPLPFLKKLMKEPGVFITKGSTFENARHLAKPFLQTMKLKYENTLLGKQELFADIIEENHCENLWTPTLLENAKKNYKDLSLKRIVISIDPAVTSNTNSDETGIIVAGINSENYGVVLEDLSLKTSPYQWAKRAIDAYHEFKADRIIAEVNMGGDLVESMIRVQDPNVSFKSVRASRGKYSRAEPIASLYQQNRIWHKKAFLELEKQMLYYAFEGNKKSPDRLDALVWGLTELMFHQNKSSLFHMWCHN